MHSRQLIEIDPSDLMAALQRDVETSRANHKSRMGQIVGLNLSRRNSLSSSPRGYTILRLLSCPHDECSYRIDTTTEATERVATAAQLLVRAPISLRAVA